MLSDKVLYCIKRLRKDCDNNPTPDLLKPINELLRSKLRGIMMVKNSPPQIPLSLRAIEGEVGGRTLVPPP